MITTAPRPTVVPAGTPAKPASHVISVNPDGSLNVPGAVESVRPTERIALVGAPGSGKTTSAKTFPDRLWLDYDHKLPIGERSIPFWDPAYCNALVTPKFKGAPPNRRDATKKWIRDNGPLLPENITLIMDSWTMFINAVQQQIALEEADLDKPNKYFQWQQLLKYCVEITEMFKGLKCRLIVLLHETPERDDEGNLTGKLNPVMQGSFKDQLLGHFTDVWHQVAHPYEVDANGRKIMENGKLKVKHGWYWELGNCAIFNCNTNPVLGKIVREKKINMIPADYEELQKLYSLS